MDRIRRKRLGQHTAGKGDDAATDGDVLGRLRQDQERPPQVCRNDLVEQFYVALADRRKRHDSRVVDDHINAPNFFMVSSNSRSTSVWLATSALTAIASPPITL